MRKKNLFKILFSAACAVSLLGCEDTPDSGKAGDVGKFAIFLTVDDEITDPVYYTLTLNDLNKDTKISPVNSGIVSDADLFWANYYSAYSNGNFYFTMDGNVMSKQHISAGKYREVGNVVVQSGSWELGMMKTLFNSNGLNFISWQTSYNATDNVLENKLYIIDTVGAMTVKADKPLKFPMPKFTLYDYEGKVMQYKDMPLTPTSFTVRDNKVFIGYYYDWSTKIDTAYMLICDYPSLNNVKVLKDTRLGHVSGAWYASSSSFTDELGDYYFTTINNKKEYGLLRIKKGSTVIDTDYAYDLKELGDVSEAEGDYAASDHHAYLNNGLAFIGSYIVDVHTKTVVQDLNAFGLGKVQKSMETYTEDGGNDLYVILKTEDARWFIAKYDVKKNTLNRGVEIDGGITAVSRISRLR